MAVARPTFQATHAPPDVCDVVTQWLIGHLTGGDEQYDIMSTNCTLFARACCKAAGVEFPGTRIPTFSSKGVGLVFTPNKLYANLEKSTFSFDPSIQNAFAEVPGAGPGRSSVALSLGKGRWRRVRAGRAGRDAVGTRRGRYRRSVSGRR